MSAATVARLELDMPDAEYHAHPALSATSMKWLLRSPAYYRQRRDHRVEKASFDLGHAVHAKVLGVGMGVVAYPAEHLTPAGNVSTKAATTAWADEQRAAGLAPVPPDRIARIDAMAERVLTHAKAGPLLELPSVREVSLFGADEQTGMHIRGRLDILADLPDGDALNVDLKTASSVERRSIRRSIEAFGYDIQSEVYRELVRQATGRHLAPTRLIFVESEPPHEVRVVSLAHPDWVEGGRMRMRQAIDIYAACVASGQWPGDDDAPGDPEAIEPRPYYLADLLDFDEIEVA